MYMICVYDYDVYMHDIIYSMYVRTYVQNKSHNTHLRMYIHVYRG